MSLNDEKPSTSKAASTKSNESVSIDFENLMKRLHCAQAGVKRIKAAYDEFMASFGDFDKNDEIVSKKKGRLENKSADEILKLLLSSPSLPTPPSSPEPQPSTSIAASSEKCCNTSTKNESDNDQHCLKPEKEVNDATNNADQDYHNITNGEDISMENNLELQEFPKKGSKKVILGPNGTEVDLQAYNSINWLSAAGATRYLTGLVFSNDILATHTLTGKPSPAFYGRERPEKMQLDQNKIVDIIYCIRKIMKCTEREVRAAITTKCSDISKKYKRRSQKRLRSD